MGKEIIENKIEKYLHHLTFTSLIVFSLGVFTSVSFSALGHILLFFPGLYFAYKFCKKEQITLSQIGIILVILTIISSVIFNRDILPASLSNLFKLKYFLISFLGIYALKNIPKGYFTDKKIAFLLNLFLFATTIASASGLVAYYTGFNYLKGKPACHPERACGLYGMYMTYGYGISLFMVLLSGLLIYWDEVKKWVPFWWLGICFAINGFGLFIALARGGWIGYVIALPCFFLKKNKKKMLKILASSVVMLILCYGLIKPFREMISNREGSNNQRVTFAQTAIVAFKERPIFGWGYRNFEPNVKALKVKYNIGDQYFGGHAHNNYLEHLASTGILGFLAIVFFSFAWIFETYKREDLIARLTFPFVLSFIVAGQFQYTFGDGENLFLIMSVFMLSEIKSVGIFRKKALPES